MKLSSSFEIVDIAGEYLLVPVGDKATTFRGVVALNEASGFLLKHMMNTHKSVKDLADLLLNEYSIDRISATKDVIQLIDKLYRYGVIEK